MNIIYLGKYTLNDYYSSAGAKRVQNQIEYLKKQNRVKVITISKYKSEYKYHRNLRRFNNKILQLSILPIYWFIICTLLILNRNKGKNVILLESVVELNFSIPILFGKLLGYKIVHDVVENFFLSQELKSAGQKFNSTINRLFYSYTKSYTDGIIVISEKLLNQYNKFNIAIIKVYNSVEFKQVKSSNFLNNKSFTFLYSGSFGVKDGVKDLIAAFNTVSKKHNNLKLVLTGANNSDYFHECIELLKDSDKIFYLGYLSIEALQNEYQMADVLMVIRDNSSFADFGFPFKLSEYLSYKKPVIASSVSDIPSLFSDYIDILMVEPSNVDSIADKMKFAIEHTTELKQLAENGYIKVNEYFSIPKNGETLYNFLMKI